jgi:hypothetical protein
MNHAEFTQIRPQSVGVDEGRIGSEQETNTRALDRRVCVAPMMDCTDKTDFPRESD